MPRETRKRRRNKVSSEEEGEPPGETRRRRKKRRTQVVKSQLERVKWQSQVDVADDKPQPNSILRVTQEQYDKAMQYLNAPAKKQRVARDLVCSTEEFPIRTRSQECVMSDPFMFQQMTNCLEEGDLDGFVTAETGAFGTRKARQLKTDLIMVSCCFRGPDRILLMRRSFQAALYLLFYHPAAKDPEVFNRCIESLFNNKHSRIGGADQILKMIKNSFASLE